MQEGPVALTFDQPKDDHTPCCSRAIYWIVMGNRLIWGWRMICDFSCVDGNTRGEV